MIQVFLDVYGTVAGFLARLSFGEAMPTRGEPNQGTGQVTSQGMSPMAKALLALLAIYAMKNMRRAGLRAEPAGRAPRRCQRRPARRRRQPVAGSAIWGLLDSQHTRRNLRGSACSFLCSRCPLNCPLRRNTPPAKLLS
jgi:hypothetical protein